jgi:cellulose synthase/poly-beta-1,6-N-acetylglucosamine synthase-like glycosyltransferase
MPVYNERPEAIEATLEACLRQTYPISHIFVIDDASEVPAAIPKHLEGGEKVSLTRLPQNQKNAAARNVGLAKCTSPLIACINCEVLPAQDWLTTCVNYLSERPHVGVCYTRTVPDDPDRLLSRWRMRFQENRFGPETGNAHFATGHAVLFRREAIERVGRYDIHLGNVSEDSDICERISAAGWETHFIGHSQCVSIQNNTVAEFARKELSRNAWESPKDYPLSRFILQRTRMLIIRMGRNVVKGRFLFLPVDAAVWAVTIKLAISKTLAARNRPVTRSVDTTAHSE